MAGPWRIIYAGSLNLKPHGGTDVSVYLTLEHAWLRVLQPAYYHSIQCQPSIPPHYNAIGFRIFGGNVTFPRGDTDSSLRASRLPPLTPSKPGCGYTLQPRHLPFTPSAAPEQTRWGTIGGLFPASTYRNIGQRFATSRVSSPSHPLQDSL